MDKINFSDVEIFPERALELLQTNKRNRPMNKNLVLNYSSQMQKGIWKFNGEPIIISNNGILLDGQHRLAAVIKSNTKQRFIVLTGFDENVFDTIDTGKTRTPGDIFSLLEIPNSVQVSSIIASYFVIKNGFSNFSNAAVQTKLTKTELLAKYKEFPHLFDRITIKSRKFYSHIKLLSSRIIGGYMTYLILDKNHNEEIVYSFFAQLFFGENIENSSILLLRQRLLKSLIGQNKLTDYYRHILVIKTWNAYISGKEIKQLVFKIENDLVPVFI